MTGGNAGRGGAGGQGAVAGNAGSTSGAAGTGTSIAGVLPVTRVARLTHTQYQNAVDELFGVSDDSASAFAPDALNGFAFDTTLDLRVDARLGPQYRAAAEALAARAVTDDAVFERIVPCDDASCSEEFIATFGERVFRRPLTSVETERFGALFAAGETLVASGDAFRDGVRLVVEAMLQTPDFLYRTELGASAGSDGLITLDAWELASRLSFFLWNSIPDAALLADARSGALSTPAGLETAIARLLADDRAVATALSFHEQAFHWNRYASIAPDAGEYPDAPPDFAARAEESSRRFVAEVIESGGGLEELLTAPYAFVDSALAPLYGVDVQGGFERVDFDGGERQGLLMQVGFLASNSYAIETDPIHRGLFVVRDVLCRHVDEPPPGATETEPPETDTPPETTREEIELLTGQATCAGCHLEINAPGFAFEGFDATGAARAEEDGVPVDTSGSFELDGATVSFDGPSTLVGALAQSAEARACYSGKWLEYAYGRNLAADDAPARSELAATPRSIRELLRAVATTKAFVKRAPNEVGP